MLIGITGKSGSGKTFVAEWLKNKLDATLLKFDQISHEVVASNSYKLFVRSNISNDVFDENQNIDRKKLGEIVFNDPQKLELINKFAEEKMIEIIDKKLQKCTKKYIILDYILLPLMKYFKICDLTILIESNKNTRFERVKTREKISKDYFEKRDKTSPNFEDFNFDLIFENSNQTNLENLFEQIKEKLCLENL